jgi:hypothetical protein
MSLGIHLVAMLVLSIGCSATPIKPGLPQTSFQRPIEEVQKAAVNALPVFGFEVQKQERTYVEGYRSRTWGLFCSPGGETAGVWLEETGTNQVNVAIHTAKSAFGIACQKDWSQSIRDEMQKNLTSAGH